MFSRALFTISAFFLLAALLVSAEPIAIERRQIASVFNSITSDAGSIFSDATSGGASLFSEATSAGAAIVTEVTSIGGNAATIITSAGGAAVTLATDGFGEVTTFAGQVYTIATGAAVSAASQATHTSNAGMQSFTISTSLVASLASVLGGIFMGAWMVL